MAITDLNDGDLISEAAWQSMVDQATTMDTHTTDSSDPHGATLTQTNFILTELQSNLIPDGDDTRDLGSTTKHFKRLYLHSDSTAANGGIHFDDTENTILGLDDGSGYLALANDTVEMYFGIAGDETIYCGGFNYTTRFEVSGDFFVGGEYSGHITPTTDNNKNIGTGTKRWQEIAAVKLRASATKVNAVADIIDHINGTIANAHSDHVDTTGNETIAGVKTFSSFPVTPSSAPTTNYQVANKKYVDDLPNHTGITEVEILRKTSEEIVNNSSTLQDDDDIQLTVSADEIWYWMLYLRVNSASNADIKFKWDIANADIYWNSPTGIGVEKTEDTTEVLATTGVNQSGQYFGTAMNYMDGSTDTTMKLQWAQNTARVSDTKVLADTYLTAWRVL